MDNIIIATPDFETHLKILKELFVRLNDMGLMVNKEKCEFVRNELKYLGYVVDKRGLRPDPDKIKSMVDFPTPKNVKDVRQFIGLISWYRRFVTDFASRVHPLTGLTRKNKPFL